MSEVLGGAAFVLVQRRVFDWYPVEQAGQIPGGARAEFS